LFEGIWYSESAQLESFTSKAAKIYFWRALMNSYNVTLRYEDRKTGSEGKTVKVDASSIAGAIGKATREFVAALDRKQRFDANKGLHVEAVRASTGSESALESEPEEKAAAE
jgi:hypothetical protein